MRLRIPESVVFEVVDGQAVLLDLSSGTYFSLNDTGTRIWQLIEAHGDRDVVLRAMREEYAADEDLISRDLNVLVEELVNRGLVEAVSH